MGSGSSRNAIAHSSSSIPASAPDDNIAKEAHPPGTPRAQQRCVADPQPAPATPPQAAPPPANPPAASPTHQASKASSIFNAEFGRALLSFIADGAEAVLQAHSAGQVIASVIRLLRDQADSCGAASENCRRLRDQAERVVGVIARALAGDGLDPLVADMIRTKLLPILERARVTVTSWQGRGKLEQFFAGRKADADFVGLHVDLRDCYQDIANAQTLLNNRSRRAADTGSDAAQPPSLLDMEQGEVAKLKDTSVYCSVEANARSFERLLLLFVICYRPAENRNAQRQRMLGILRALNTGPAWAGVPMHSTNQQGQPVEDGARNSTPGKTAVLAARLNNRLAAHGDAREELRAMLRNILANCWGLELVPGTSHIGVMRRAVQAALQPLREATGELALPQAPVEGVQPLDDLAARLAAPPSRDELQPGLEILEL